MSEPVILLVEDETIIALDAKQSLESFGYRVLDVLSDGEEAVTVALSCKPDLILMDIILQGEIDGIEAARRIKETLDIPVIYMTANADETTINRARDTLPASYLNKPISRRDLHSNVDSVLTSRKMQKELRESTARYKELFDNMKSGVAVYLPADGGKDFIITDFNSAAEKINNIKRSDVIGKKVSEAFPGIIEMGLLEVFKQVHKTGRPESLPAVYYSNAGLSYWAENYVYKLPSGEIVAIHDDVTDRVEMQNLLTGKNRELIKLNEELEALNDELTATNEELEATSEEMEASNEELIYSNSMLHHSETRFRLLFERAPVGIFHYERSLVITDVNEQFCRILNTEISKLKGLDMNNLNDLNIIPALQKPFSGEVGEYEGEYKSTLSQSRIHISMKTVPLADENGLITSAMGIVNDISDFVKKEKEKEIYIKEIHHRVKNNLQVVTSLIGLQAMNLKNTESQAQLAIAQNRIRAMSLIHERLYQSDNYAEIDFEDYIKSIASELYHAYSEFSDGIELKFSTSPVKLSINQAIPCGIMINELVTNSLKHAFKENVKPDAYIKVELHEDGDRVFICVEDNGTGLGCSLDEKNTTLGLTLVSLEIQQLAGHLDIQKEGATRFAVNFSKK